MKRYLLFLALGGSAIAAEPAWWTASGTAIKNGAPANNAGPVAEAQLKLVASRAATYLNNTLPGGAGDEINVMVNGFQRSDTYLSAVTLAQLKAVTKPFYDRLLAYGFNTKLSLQNHGAPGWAYDYPWNPATPKSANLAPAALAQLKWAFSFDLTGFTGTFQAVNQQFTFAEDGSQPITLKTTPPSSSLLYTVTSGPSHGVLLGTPPNLVYWPNAHYIGGDSFTFTASDGTTTRTGTITLTTTVTNHAPLVDAGPIVNAIVGQSVAMAGSAYDLEGDAVSFLWSKLDGPGDAVFAMGTSATTGVTFSAAGTYHLTLTGTSGAFTSSDTVTVVVKATGAPAGPSVTLSAPSSLTLPGVVLFTATTGGTTTKVEFYEGARLIGVRNTAPFTLPWTTSNGHGIYRFQAVAYNGSASTVSNSVTVTVHSGIAGWAEGTSYGTGNNGSPNSGGGGTGSGSGSGGGDPNAPGDGIASRDTDLDGLTDVEESAIGSNAGADDTDGDTVKDGEDGWAQAQDGKLFPPRLPKPAYAVIDLVSLLGTDWLPGKSAIQFVDDAGRIYWTKQIVAPGFNYYCYDPATGTSTQFTDSPWLVNGFQVNPAGYVWWHEDNDWDNPSGGAVVKVWKLGAPAPNPVVIAMPAPAGLPHTKANSTGSVVVSDQGDIAFTTEFGPDDSAAGSIGYWGEATYTKTAGGNPQMIGQPSYSSRPSGGTTTYHEGDAIYLTCATVDAQGKTIFGGWKNYITPNPTASQWNNRPGYLLKDTTLTAINTRPNCFMNYGGIIVAFGESAADTPSGSYNVLAAFLDFPLSIRNLLTKKNDTSSTVDHANKRGEMITAEEQVVRNGAFFNLNDSLQASTVPPSTATLQGVFSINNYGSVLAKVGQDDYRLFVPNEFWQDNKNLSYDLTKEALGVSHWVTNVGLPKKPDTKFEDVCDDPMNFRICATVEDPTKTSVDVTLQVFHEDKTSSTPQVYTLTDKKGGFQFKSCFLRLVTDAYDDASSGNGVGTPGDDHDPDKQTIRVKLGDKLKITYLSKAGKTVSSEIFVGRPMSEQYDGANQKKFDIREIKLHVVVFKDVTGNDCVTPTQVTQDISDANERLAQAGIRIKLVPAPTYGQPAGPLADDYFRVRLHSDPFPNPDEAHVMGWRDTDPKTLDIFYVPPIVDRPSGSTRYHNQGYTYNQLDRGSDGGWVIIAGVDEDGSYRAGGGKPFTLPHEIMHATLNWDHGMSPDPPDTSLFFPDPTSSKGVASEKRLAPYNADQHGVTTSLESDTVIMRTHAETLW